MATSSRCPREGGIILIAASGEFMRMRTHCKTWRCLGCRDRLKRLFRMRVQAGCLILGRCLFITLTYKAGSQRLNDVACVRKDWQALWRRLKLHQDPIAKKKWLRVMELTKKGTPHHHLVMGGFGTDDQLRCYGPVFDVRRFRQFFDTCPCVSHRVSREWHAITGDSFICHVVPVVSPKGAGAYMGKYLLKTFDGDRAKALGMARRWSTSHGWPGTGRLRLKQTEEGGWIKRQYKPGRLHDDQVEGDMERTGNPLQILLQKSSVTKAKQYEIIRRIGRNA